MIWLISDLHFNHQKEFIYQPRGFSSVAEMNEALISNYNEVVRYNDTVYILGDLCLGGANSIETNRNLLKQLKGEIYIIRGNHDSDIRIDMYKTLYNVKTVENAMYLKYGGLHFYLSHYPTMTTNFDFEKPIRQRLWNFAGHTHTKDKFLNMNVGCYHCEVDAHNNYPINIDEAIEDIKKYYKIQGVV